jgi:hypothetical protein
MKQKSLILMVAVLAVMAAGCAITDYDGWPNHQTSAEAKLFGSEVSFIVGDPNLDGTYSYTVKYDNRGGVRDSNMKIISYRNPVPDSFSQDGMIDRDGDDVQGRSGILGGKFLTEWVAVDPAPDCQFEANITQDHSHGAGPGVFFCTTTNEEIDKDLDLQASFSSTGDLLSKIWSGVVTGGFTAELNGVAINGTNHSLAQPVSIGAISNGMRPARLTIDLTTPAGKALIQTLLSNTSDRVPVTLSLNFAGGMQLALPAQVKVAFNHDALFNLL